MSCVPLPVQPADVLSGQQFHFAWLSFCTHTRHILQGQYCCSLLFLYSGLNGSGHFVAHDDVLPSAGANQLKDILSLQPVLPSLSFTGPGCHSHCLASLSIED